MMVFIVLFLFQYYGILVNSAPTDLQLELVEVLFRHGDRTPRFIETYPNEPIEDRKIYEKLGYGQLTDKGKRREYHLGEMLRKKYGHFLGNYKAGNVMALSSNTDRTVTSLQTLLAGLYPPPSEMLWNKNLSWIPIPTYTVLYQIDGIFGIRDCLAYKNEFNRVETTYAKELLEPYKEFIKFMEEKSGIVFDNTEKFKDFWSLIESKVSMGMQPSWVTDEFLSKLREIVNIRVNLRSYSIILKKFNGGLILRALLNNLEDSNPIQGEERKIYLYGTHDTTMGSVVRTLNISNHRIPNYGSAIVLEKLVDRNTRQHFIKLGVFNDKQEYYEETKLVNCPVLCPMEEFKRILKPVIPTLEESTCRMKEMTQATINATVNTNSMKIP